LRSQGTQLENLEGFSEAAVDDIVGGIKRALLNEPPEVPLDEYMQKADRMIYQREAKKEEAFLALGNEALEKAAAEDGAIKTESGLVFLSLTEGSGPSPSAADAVEVHYEGALVDGPVFDSS
tara:strand:- start:697 stop:1062 length:366 start_codon:yes stop_codon:yes gene_type:complete